MKGFERYILRVQGTKINKIHALNLNNLPIPPIKQLFTSKFFSCCVAIH